MPILPWLKSHVKEILIVGTALLSTRLTAKSAVTEQEADLILGEETPLERITRRATGILLVSLGDLLKKSTYVYPQFGQEVGDTLIKYGERIYAREDK